MIEGGCFCGKIRYTIDPGEYPIVNCHCSMCRKISGAPFVTWIVVPRESLKYLQGSLDDPDRYIPTRAVHEESKLNWLHRTE